MSTYRPRIIRDEDGGIDEKIATGFADKAIRAIQADVAQDLGVDNMIKGPKPSLGNIIGMERFADRVKKLARGKATLTFQHLSEKKRFDMLWDRLRVANDNRLVFYRHSLHFERHREPTAKTYDMLSISRHALIRSIKHYPISSVDDVLHFLKLVWDGAHLLAGVMAAIRPTTPGKTCWLVPVPYGPVHHMGLMLGRPTVKELPTLVTILPDHWLPDGCLELAQELEDALLMDFTVPRKERDVAILAALARMLK